MKTFSKKNCALFLCLVIVLSTVFSGCTSKTPNTTPTEPAPTATPTEAPTPTPVPEAELAVDAVANMKTGWNLGNALDSWMEGSKVSTTLATSKYETYWGNVVTTKEFIKKIHDLGFGVVRVPVTWRNHLDADGNINEEWMARVEEVVNYVLENDMYCIINVHHDTGEKGWLKASTKNYEENHELFEKIWTQIATRFQDYPDKLLFEGFNEMLDEKNEWSNPGNDAISAIAKYNKSFVDTVRATGGLNGTRNLICNTYAAAVTVASRFRLPQDSVKGHLIAEVHTYAPTAFTFTNVTWTTETDKFTDDLKSEIDWNLSTLNTNFVKKGIPVIIGEYGSSDKKNTEDRAAYASYVVSNAAKYGIVCIMWDNGGKADMGVISRDSNPDPAIEIVEAVMKVFQ